MIKYIILITFFLIPASLVAAYEDTIVFSQDSGSLIRSNFPEKYHQMYKAGPNEGMLVLLDDSKGYYLEILLERDEAKLTLSIFDVNKNPLKIPQEKIIVGHIFPQSPENQYVSGWYWFFPEENQESFQFVSIMKEYRTLGKD